MYPQITTVYLIVVEYIIYRVANTVLLLCLFAERVYEEHESLVENLMLWTRDSKNKLYFVERPERLLLFQRPEIFHPEYNSISTLEDELSQNSLVEVSKFKPDFMIPPEYSCEIPCFTENKMK